MLVSFVRFACVLKRKIHFVKCGWGRKTDFQGSKTMSRKRTGILQRLVSMKARGC